MKSLLAVAILLAGTIAQGDDCRCAVTGKVVAVPDGGSLWVYVDHARASYHIALAGVNAPSIDQPAGKSVRDALANLVNGQEVRVEFDVLCADERITGNVFQAGQSVNNQIAFLLTPTTVTSQPAIVYVQSPRRPLLSLYLTLRQILPVLPGRD